MNKPNHLNDTLINFTCNGRGRGGHYHVRALVTKVNRKTVEAVEALSSYKPGTRWIVSIDSIKPEACANKDYLEELIEKTKELFVV